MLFNLAKQGKNIRLCVLLIFLVALYRGIVYIKLSKEIWKIFGASVAKLGYPSQVFCSKYSRLTNAINQVLF